MSDLITVAFMAKELNRLPDTVKRQLQTKGIKPTEYHGPTGMYPRTALEEIRIAPKLGRPKKKVETDPVKLKKNPKKAKK